MSKTVKISGIKPGDALPTREFTCTNVQQFLYNAALWNAHRIHFDYRYATEAEGYPGLVVAGPLMGDWLTQCVVEWMGDEARLLSFEYSNRKAAYTGDILSSGGRVLDVKQATGTVGLELQISNATGEVIAPGLAVVQFPVA